MAHPVWGVVWELSAKAMRDLWLLFPYEPLGLRICWVNLGWLRLWPIIIGYFCLNHIMLSYFVCRLSFKDKPTSWLSWEQCLESHILFLRLVIRLVQVSFWVCLRMWHLQNLILYHHFPHVSWSFDGYPICDYQDYLKIAKNHMSIYDLSPHPLRCSFFAIWLHCCGRSEMGIAYPWHIPCLEPRTRLPWSTCSCCILSPIVWVSRWMEEHFRGNFHGGNGWKWWLTTGTIAVFPCVPWILRHTQMANFMALPTRWLLFWGRALI